MIFVCPPGRKRSKVEPALGSSVGGFRIRVALESGYHGGRLSSRRSACTSSSFEPAEFGRFFLAQRDLQNPNVDCQTVTRAFTATNMTCQAGGS